MEIGNVSCALATWRKKSSNNKQEIIDNNLTHDILASISKTNITNGPENSSDYVYIAGTRQYILGSTGLHPWRFKMLI